MSNKFCKRKLSKAGFYTKCATEVLAPSDKVVLLRLVPKFEGHHGEERQSRRKWRDGGSSIWGTVPRQALYPRQSSS